MGIFAGAAALLGQGDAIRARAAALCSEPIPDAPSDAAVLAEAEALLLQGDLIELDLDTWKAPIAARVAALTDAGTAGPALCTCGSGRTDLPTIACTKCTATFHLECIALSPERAEEIENFFECAACDPERETLYVGSL